MEENNLEISTDKTTSRTKSYEKLFSVLNKEKWKFSWLFLVFGFMILDIFLIKNDFNKSENISQIIVTLLPVILAVISFSISASSLRIYGVEIRDLKKLQSKTSFSLYEMFFITLLIVFLFFVFTTANLYATAILLNVISFIFTIIFLFQELKFIIKDDKKLLKMVKKNLWWHLSNVMNSFDHKNPILEEVLKNLIVTKGLKYIFDLFKTENNELNAIMFRDFLITSQYKYILDLYVDFEILNENEKKSYKGVDLIEFFETTIENINSILNDKEYFYFLFQKDLNNHYLISHTIIYLQVLVNHFNHSLFLERRFLKIFDEFAKYLKDSDDENNFFLDRKFLIYKILNSILFESLINNEIWFLKLMKDHFFQSAVSFHMPKEYFIFICLFVYQIIGFQEKSENYFREELKKFIFTEKYNLSEDFTIWSDIFKFSISTYNSPDSFLLLKQLLEIYYSSFNILVVTWRRKNRPKISIESAGFSTSFSPNFIVDFWIYFMYSPRKYFFGNDLKEVSVTDYTFLNQETKYQIMVTSNKIKTGQKIGIGSGVYNFFNFEEIDENYSTFHARENLFMFSNDVGINYYENELSSEFKTWLINRSIFYKYKQNFIETINRYKTYSKQNDEFCGVLYSNSFLLTNTSRVQYQLEQTFSINLWNYIVENIHNKITNCKNVSLDNYNDEFSTILNFEPTGVQGFNYNKAKDTDFKDLIFYNKNIKKIKFSHKKRDVFFKNEAIKISLKLDEKQTKFRLLNDDEILFFINKAENKLETGTQQTMYKYKGLNDDENESVWVDLDKFKSFILNNFFIIDVFINVEVIFDNEHILCFDVYDEMK